MLVPIFLAITWAVASAQQCPQQYARFSTHHSYCLPPNSTCQVVHKGVKNEDRKTILKVHNDYRSKLATGQEKQAGGLPPASDMMEMVWDVELESVAQKWAAQCIFKHDCKECRDVENFSVGQNLAYEEVTACNLKDQACLEKVTKPNWEEMIDMFYDEVKFFKKQLVKDYQFDERFGHFSQVGWAKTWKVGCGFIVFENGYYIRKLYACNYGPGGNAATKPMYTAGKPCSQCPSNTCCGSCKRSSYPGLCKVMNKKLGPVYEFARENSLVDCNWKKGEPTCNFKGDGSNQNWAIKPSSGGYYSSILLKGGDKSSLKLMTTIKPKSDSFCLVVVFRKSPTDASQKDSSDFTLDLDMGTGVSKIPLRSNSKNFVPYSIDLSWNYKTKVTLNFSVPPNAPDHIIDIKEISAYDGRCINNYYK